MSTPAKDNFERQYFFGERVYGDDFSPAQITEWYAQEETGYHDLTRTYRAYTYGYHSLFSRSAEPQRLAFPLQHCGCGQRASAAAPSDVSR